MEASKILLQLMCLLLWEEVYFAQLSVLEQQKGFKMADVGDNVTLQCFYQVENTFQFITWYKQRLGDKPEPLVFRMREGNPTLSEKTKNDPRFSVVSGEGINHLNISDVQLSDSAMYYCGTALYSQIQFQEGIMLIVKGSLSNVQAIVQQPPEKTVHPGETVTLNCTVHTEPCAGEHSVYWFRRSDKSQPVFFYTHDQGCEIANTTQGSFFNFSMKDFKLSDAGTYYCAVASCGEILYGNGTRLNVEDTADTTLLFLVYFLSVALVISIILVIVLSSIIYKLKWKTCIPSSGHSLGTSVSPANTDQNEDNLHYAALSLSKKSRSRTQRNVMENDTVYAGVRQ